MFLSVLEIPSLLNFFMGDIPCMYWDVPFSLGDFQLIEFFHMGYSVYGLGYSLSHGDFPCVQLFNMGYFLFVLECPLSVLGIPTYILGIPS